MKTSKSIVRVCAVVLTAGLLTTAGVTTAGAQSDESDTVTVGALFDLSGDGKTLGEASKAALEVAVADLEKKSGDVKIELDIRDTGQDPETAAREFQSLVDGGVRVIIGPQTSSEVRAIVAAGLDTSGAILVSNGSTASSLSLPGDSVFRLVPDDKVEGAATADLVREQGHDALVVAHRVDPGNDGLATSTTAAFEAEDGTVIPGPAYPPETTEFTDTIDGLNQAVSTAGGSPAVYLAGFEEVADLLAAAGESTELQGLDWYGADGSAKSQAVIDDAAAAKFAAESGGFASPLLTLTPEVERAGRKTIKKIEQKSGQQADAFSLAAYDGLRIADEAIESAGADADGAALRQAFEEAGQGFDGLTGTIELNDAGDRTTGPFAYWAVCKSGKSYAWKTIGTWTPPSTPGDAGKVAVTSCKKATG